MISALADIAHYQTSPLIWSKVWPWMISFSAKKSVLLKIVHNKKKIQIFCHEYAIYFISWSEKMNISFVASPLVKCTFFTSLDEINGIFILKIWISSFSDSFTILGLWVLGLAVSNINESQLQTFESKTLFFMTSLQYYCIPGLPVTRWNKNLCAKDAWNAGNKITALYIKPTWH